MPLSYELFEQRSVIGACSVIGSLDIVCAESRPTVRTEYIAIGYVVHIDGYAQHRRERKHVLAYVSVYECAVICAPISHDGIHVLKRAFTRNIGRKPRGRSCPFGTIV